MFLLKGGFFGALSGLVVGAILYGLTIKFMPSYPYTTTEDSQSAHGAVVTAVILSTLFILFGDPKKESVNDVTAIELLIVMPNAAILGYVSRPIVALPIYLISPNILESLTDLIGWFIAGAITPGVIGGMMTAYYLKEIKVGPIL